MNRSITRLLYPTLGLALFLAACQAPPRPSSGFVWCEYYTPVGVVYFSPVIPSQRPIRGKLCDGFAKAVKETVGEIRGIVPDTLAYPTEQEAEERRQWHIRAKRKNGLEVVTVDWQAYP